MGTSVDFLDEKAHTLTPKVTPQQAINRHFLKSIMEANGFRNYQKEWWHYTLNDEPFPDTYFDFPVDSPPANSNL